MAVIFNNERELWKATNLEHASTPKPAETYLYSK